VIGEKTEKLLSSSKLFSRTAGVYPADTIRRKCGEIEIMKVRL
jgi:hypothetical protein